MILLPWFSSATLTAASNPKKGQGFPQNGFTETCVMAKLFCHLWSNYTRPRGIILYDFSRKLIHPCVVMDVVWSSCFHTKTWDILPVCELLFSKLFLTCALNLLPTHPPPEPKISNQASLLKQIIPTIFNISEKEMQCKKTSVDFSFHGADYSFWAQVPTRPEPRTQWWVALSFCVLLPRHLWNFQDFL